MDVANIRVIEGSSRFRFAQEAFLSDRVLLHEVGQELQGDFAVELSVFGQKDLSHPAFTNLLQNLVVRNGLAPTIGPLPQVVNFPTG